MSTPHTDNRSTRITIALIWGLAFLLAGIANIFIAWADANREGEAFHLLPKLISQGSSIAMSLILLPVLLAACRRWPLQFDNLLHRLPLYIAGSVIWTLLHVGGMVGLRHLLYAALGQSYDYGPWIANLLYEYGKDAQTFFLIVAIAQSLDWYLRLQQGEARPLSEPDPGVPPVPETDSPNRPTRFLVRKLGREFLIATDDIEWLQASGNYVNLHVAGRAYPLRTTMAAIEAQLDPEHFVRVHRSHIVNLRQIASIEPTDAGDARIHMHNGTQIPCSRRYREALRSG